ncbi:hypothetical protein KGP87_24450 [Burkholderia multivorans]|nr:SOS response-associated peptidase [Burkholderia multivorans]MCO8579470.1 hypothetical protein [Burkholderia multivorans]
MQVRTSAGKFVNYNDESRPVMSRMHKRDDEKRSVVILRPADWEEWLTTSNIEAARAMLQLYPAGEMEVAPTTNT